jgi:drug/metabolite transporter (DMT)-like permease
MSAVYLVTINRVLRGHQRLARASAYSITGTLITLLALALVNGLTVPQQAAAWLSVIGIAIISTVIPIFGMLAGMRRLGAPQAAITSTLEPLLVLIFSLLLLGESMLPVQLLGGALILSGPLILHIRRRRRLAEPAGAV